MTVPRIFRGGPIFDGTRLHRGAALVVADGLVRALSEERSAPEGAIVDLEGDILSPGYVDIQVNGGGGVQFNDSPTPEGVATIAAAHRRLGTSHILPTLITDTPDKTRAAVDAVAGAIADGIPGIAGLHLEGPHLSQAKRGAHRADLIRPMAAADLDALVAAAARLPCLLVTIAPEAVTLDQVRVLRSAGVQLSLGHSDAPFQTAIAYHQAGVGCATHIFNAMSQLGSREPGLVGAALAAGGVSAGLIADGIHVHPASMRIAFAAKQGPGEVFLVSDAMAPAGTDMASFHLNGREIRRRDGRLTLADGTLAGADLDMTTAVRVLVDRVGLALDRALRAATAGPAQALGLDAGRLMPGSAAALVRIRSDLSACTPPD